ncbi:hypothetical protein TYRP_018035 [Tyrophagus putrescentiae]|nr:hypothetical protein TYRP_018035 [Tyrophagus putrescentiae]
MFSRPLALAAATAEAVGGVDGGCRAPPALFACASILFRTLFAWATAIGEDMFELEGEAGEEESGEEEDAAAAPAQAHQFLGTGAQEEEEEEEECLI